MFFASDNTSGAAPEVLAALIAANDGYAMPYGSEPLMDEVRTGIRAVFEAPEAAVYLVATGTAANSLSLALMTKPWQAIYCHRHAHIAEDECGAPEFYTGGAKLVLIDGAHGKMAAADLGRALEGAAAVGVHNVQRGMLSLTNTTEAGTVYSSSEVAKLAALAKRHGMPVHLDGARFANALVAAGCTPAEMTWKAGVDILSFGGTKNGCLGVEAVVIFDPKLAWEFELRRKRGGHLFSKHRFLAAQMAAYLRDGLWLKLATSANARARALSQGIVALPEASLMHPTDANIVFATWPREGHRRATKAGARYDIWTPGEALDGDGAAPVSARLVCSWSTTDKDVADFLTLIRG